MKLIHCFSRSFKPGKNYLYTTFISLLLFVQVAIPKTSQAQSPSKISFESMVSDSNNLPVINDTVSFRFSVLKGTFTGAVVYSETNQTVTDNMGHVSLEIGGGNVINGDFSQIKWADGPYFLELESDPYGGTNYVINGTSKLPSAPYALYAMNADTILNDSLGQSGHYIGELYGGGVIFWLDKTGAHGLIVSMIDISTNAIFSNVNVIIGPSAESTWDGMTNSISIAGQAGQTTSAAKLCLDFVNADYGTGIFTDWYLPSSGEINLLWNNLGEVQKAIENDGNPYTLGIQETSYWVSEEDNTNAYYAWQFYFRFGVYYDYDKGSQSLVRPIRQF